MCNLCKQKMYIMLYTDLRQYCDASSPGRHMRMHTAGDARCNCTHKDACRSLQADGSLHGMHACMHTCPHTRKRALPAMGHKAVSKAGMYSDNHQQQQLCTACSTLSYITNFFWRVHLHMFCSQTTCVFSAGHVLAARYGHCIKHNFATLAPGRRGC